jgi:hypothetical protein
VRIRYQLDVRQERQPLRDWLCRMHEEDDAPDPSVLIWSETPPREWFP